MRNMKKRYLVLENGRCFEGEAIGAEGDGLGELVFTTGMTGYLETLTDPSYAGQIIMQTFPLIGNYGVIPEDFEGRSMAKGYVVRELCDAPSNFRSEYGLDRFLKEHGIPGICGVDTRAVTRIIREHGVMNACISDAPECDPVRIKSYTVAGAVAAASCDEKTEIPAAGAERYHVVLMDYGAKRHIAENLISRGCRVTVLPHDASAEDVLALEPDGLMLSNGPGDPKENTYEISQLSRLIGKMPVFGICLGHQLAALALGGETVKLKYGHRGANQPVRDLKTGRCYITSQNHGYAVLSDSVAGTGVLRCVNANDMSCEGIDYPELNCFTVQFHPEACAGPRDTGFLFDRFVSMMGGAEDA